MYIKSCEGNISPRVLFLVTSLRRAAKRRLTGFQSPATDFARSEGEGKDQGKGKGEGEGEGEGVEEGS